MPPQTMKGTKIRRNAPGGGRLTRAERHELLSAIVGASERFESILQRALPSNL